MYSEYKNLEEKFHLKGNLELLRDHFPKLSIHVL